MTFVGFTQKKEKENTIILKIMHRNVHHRIWYILIYFFLPLLFRDFISFCWEILYFVKNDGNYINVYFCCYIPTLYYSVSYVYSCVADNSLGRAKKYIEVSGRPGPAQFHSPLYSRSRDVYNLTWSIESVPLLDEIRILYRKLLVNH